MFDRKAGGGSMLRITQGHAIYLDRTKFQFNLSTDKLRRGYFQKLALSDFKLMIRDSMLEERSSFHSVSKPKMQGKCLDIQSSQKKRDPLW